MILTFDITVGDEDGNTSHDETKSFEAGEVEEIIARLMDHMKKVDAKSKADEVSIVELVGINIDNQIELLEFFEYFDHPRFLERVEDRLN